MHEIDYKENKRNEEKKEHEREYVRSLLRKPK